MVNVDGAINSGNQMNRFLFRYSLHVYIDSTIARKRREVLRRIDHEWCRHQRNEAGDSFECWKSFGRSFTVLSWLRTLLLLVARGSRILHGTLSRIWKNFRFDELLNDCETSVTLIPFSTDPDEIDLVGNKDPSAPKPCAPTIEAFREMIDGYESLHVEIEQIQPYQVFSA